MSDKRSAIGVRRAYREPDELVVSDLRGRMIPKSRKLADVAEIAPRQILVQLECAECRKVLSYQAHSHWGWPGDVVQLQLLYLGRDMAGMTKSHEQHGIRLDGVEVNAEFAESVEGAKVPLDGKYLKVCPKFYAV